LVIFKIDYGVFKCFFSIIAFGFKIDFCLKVCFGVCIFKSDFSLKFWIHCHVVVCWILSSPNFWILREYTLGDFLKEDLKCALLGFLLPRVLLHPFSLSSTTIHGGSFHRCLTCINCLCCDGLWSIYDIVATLMSLVLHRLTHDKDITLNITQI